MKNTIKRIAAGFLTLAFVAGATPANVGGFLKQSTTIVASAEVKPFTDTLTVADTGATTSFTYVTWSDVTKHSGAVYAGKNATTDGAIRMRTTSSTEDSGIVTTASGGKAKKIKVVWNSLTSDKRILDIYGKNEKYESSNDLNDSKKRGVSIGSIARKTSDELEIEGDYKYIGLRANSDAVYLDSISITWEKTDISQATVTLAANNMVSSLTVDDKTITDLSSFDITYGTDEDHSSTTVPTEPGTYYAYVTPKSTNTDYTGTAKSAGFVIEAQKPDISQANVTFEILRQKYTGGELSPKYTVKIGNTILTEGTDFTVEGSTVGTAPGEYNITFYGMGDFGGSKNETWYIDALNTYNVQVNNGYIKNYDYGEYNFSENTKITLVPDDPYINGGWFAYNSSTNAYDILVSTTPNYSFYVKSNVSFMWKELTSDQIETTVNGTAAISFGNCTNMSDKYVIPVSGSWELPAGAKIVKGGTYRMYKDFGTAAPTQNELKNSGTWKTTSLKSNKGTFNYNINVSKSGSNYQKDLYVMTYVEYKLGNDTYTVMSNVSKQYTDDTITNY